MTLKNPGYAVESLSAGDVEVGETCGTPAAERTELAAMDAPEQSGPITSSMPSSMASMAASAATVPSQPLSKPTTLYQYSSCSEFM